jgi:hypothetical protein
MKSTTMTLKVWLRAGPQSILGPKLKRLKMLKQNQNLKLVTGPAEEPVTLAEAKLHLRVDLTEDDTLITNLIKAARLKLEDYAGIKFISQTWLVSQDSFPFALVNDWWDGVRDTAVTELRAPCKDIVLPIGPVSSVTSFNTFDDADQSYATPANIYALDKYSNQGRLSLRIGQIWPTTILRGNGGIEITVVAGLAPDRASTPDDIKQAVLEAVSYWYENRGDLEKLKLLPATAMGILEGYRRLKC